MKMSDNNRKWQTVAACQLRWRRGTQEEKGESAFVSGISALHISGVIEVGQGGVTGDILWPPEVKDCGRLLAVKVER